MLRGDRSGNGPNCNVHCSGARSSGEREVASVASQYGPLCVRLSQPRPVEGLLDLMKSKLP
eukprot:1166374-Alexandrium_andersonii.AAC.1